VDRSVPAAVSVTIQSNAGRYARSHYPGEPTARRALAYGDSDPPEVNIEILHWALSVKDGAFDQRGSGTGARWPGI